MTADPKSGGAAHDRQWFIVSRWQEYEGEARANLLRIVGIAAFYIIELINHGGRIGTLQLPKVSDDRFHASVTALAVAWTMVALVTLVCLRRQFFPAALKFVTTACDLVLLTAVLTIADGPRSPLIVVYFLIIALAALRLNLRLMWMTTLGSMAGYLFLVGYADYWASADRAELIRVPRVLSIDCSGGLGSGRHCLGTGDSARASDGGGFCSKDRGQGIGARDERTKTDGDDYGSEPTDPATRRLSRLRRGVFARGGLLLAVRVETGRPSGRSPAEAPRNGIDIWHRNAAAVGDARRSGDERGEGRADHRHGARNRDFSGGALHGQSRGKAETKNRPTDAVL